MGEDRAIEQIDAGTRRSGKTYAFNEAHDETRPVDFWFQGSDEGLILFVVFYCLACRWSQCVACNLPSRSGRRHVSYKALMRQIDRVFADAKVSVCKQDIRKVIVSNNGSVLDQKTFSSTALMYLLAKLNLHLPKLEVFSIETRPEYVDLPELEFVARALAEGDTPSILEIAIGFEAQDDHIRNQVFRKGLTLEGFEKLVRECTPYGFHIKCYFMQKPVAGMSDEQAVQDIRHGIDYLSEVAERYRTRINMHINPTFVAAGTPLEQAFRSNRYSPPFLHDVAAAVWHARKKPISVFIGLFDEGLAVEGGSFIRPGEEDLVEQIEAFNRTQDFDILDRLAQLKPTR